MITISILGLDQFVVGDYSHEVTARLAELYEVEQDDIYFYAPLAYIYHDGSDQSAFNVIVKIEADQRYQRCEKAAYELIKDTLTKYVIHFNLQFIYFNEEHVYSFYNDEYPLFMDNSNTVCSDDVSYDDNDDDEDEEDDENINIFTGNAFEGFDEKVAKKRQEVENASKVGTDEFKSH